MPVRKKMHAACADDNGGIRETAGKACPVLVFSQSKPKTTESFIRVLSVDKECASYDGRARKKASQKLVHSVGDVFLATSWQRIRSIPSKESLPCLSSGFYPRRPEETFSVKKEPLAAIQCKTESLKS